jgi:hypothetical protein
MPTVAATRALMIAAYFAIHSSLVVLGIPNYFTRNETLHAPPGEERQDRYRTGAHSFTALRA